MLLCDVGDDTVESARHIVLESAVNQKNYFVITNIDGKTYAIDVRRGISYDLAALRERFGHATFNFIAADTRIHLSYNA
jgi:hypothetical protein